mgnify:CR=1 FL=1
MHFGAKSSGARNAFARRRYFFVNSGFAKTYASLNCDGIVVFDLSTNDQEHDEAIDIIIGNNKNEPILIALLIILFNNITIIIKYNKITIRCQHTRWGSCSSKGNLNFNCLLVLLPDEIIDSIVVHELCHIKQMNHSARFYAEIDKVFPNYKQCHLWLKQNGGMYLNRIPK